MSRITLIVIAVEVVLATIGVLAGRWLKTPIVETIRLDLPSAGLAVLATIPLVALLYRSVRVQHPSLASHLELFRKTLVPIFARCSLLDILIISLMAGVGEEIFFRGFLQGSLARVVDPWVALILVSVVFGLAHYVSLSYAIFAAIMGAYMGALMLGTGNLFVAIAVHALFDFAALLLLLRVAPLPDNEPAVP